MEDSIKAFSEIPHNTVNILETFEITADELENDIRNIETEGDNHNTNWFNEEKVLFMLFTLY